MKVQTVELGMLDIRASLGSINDEQRTVDVTFSTGAGVRRYDYRTDSFFIEELSMDPKHIRMERLNSGAPVLDSHSGWSVRGQLGVVVDGSGKVANGEARATLKLSKREDVNSVWQDITNGIVRKVSVGYAVHKFEQLPPKVMGDPPTRRAVDWEPYEISFTPLPADNGADVHRNQKAQSFPCVIVTRDMEEVMPEQKTTPEVPAVETRAALTIAPAEPAVDLAPARAEGAAAERARAAEIQTLARTHQMDAAFTEDMVQRGISVEKARAEILGKLATKTEETSTRQHVITAGEDARDKWMRGAANWLLMKAGVVDTVAKHEKQERTAYDPGEFRGLSLLDLAKDTLARAGRSTRGMDKMRIVSEAFTYRATTSTSDFTTLLENVMHKMLQASYGITPDTWSRFCAQGTVSDFRAHKRYRHGNFGTLDTVAENGEFKHKAIADGESESLTAATKGNIINVSRQMIVNDDMGVFAQLLAKLGRAAKLSVEVDVYALLALNSGDGPTMSDSVAMFHATSHGANKTTGAAITAANLDVDRVAMASQRDPNSNEILDLRPAILLVPVGLGGVARVINGSQYDPDTVANKSQMKPNIVAGLFRDIVDTPRITGTRRYLFADPSIAPVIEVAFLEGQTEPVLETRDGWNTDGTEMKVRFDYAVGGVDWRGAVTNAGQ